MLCCVLSLEPFICSFSLSIREKKLGKCLEDMETYLEGFYFQCQANVPDKF